MRYVGPAGLLATITVGLSIISHRSSPAPKSLPVPLQLRGASSGECPQCERLSVRIDSLQKSGADVETKLAALQSELHALRLKLADLPGQSAVLATEDREARHAADKERYRAYMAGVAQSFNNEQINPRWASEVAPRVNAALAGDTTLRGAHSVDCREETCRVQIESDDPVRFNQPLSHFQTKALRSQGSGTSIHTSALGECQCV